MVCRNWDCCNLMRRKNYGSPSRIACSRMQEFLSVIAREAEGRNGRLRYLPPSGVFDENHLLDVWQDGRIRVVRFGMMTSSEQ